MVLEKFVPTDLCRYFCFFYASLAALVRGWPWNLACFHAFQHLISYVLLCPLIAELTTRTSNVTSQSSFPWLHDQKNYFSDNRFKTLAVRTRLLRTNLLILNLAYFMSYFQTFLNINDIDGFLVMQLVTNVVQRRRVWYNGLVPFDGATAAMVGGHFISYPRQS